MGSISIRWRAFIQINSAAKKGFLGTKRNVGFVENCISCAGYFMTCRAVIAGARKFTLISQSVEGIS